MPIPCKCTRCKHVFESRSFRISGSSDIDLRGNYENCPKCGGMAKVGDGKFTVRNNVTSVAAAPKDTLDMLAALGAIGAKVKEEDLTVDEVVAEIAKIDPAIAKKIRKFGLPPLFLVLLAYWIWQSVQLNITIDVNKLFDQAYHLLQGEEPNFHEPQALPKADFDNARPDEPAPPLNPKASEYASVAVMPKRQSKRQARRQRGRQRERTSSRP